MKRAERQRRYRQEKHAAGLCWYCKAEATRGATCEQHAEAHQERKRKARGVARQLLPDRPRRDREKPFRERFGPEYLPNFHANPITIERRFAESIPDGHAGLFAACPWLR